MLIISFNVGLVLGMLVIYYWLKNHRNIFTDEELLSYREGYKHVIINNFIAEKDIDPSTLEEDPNVISLAQLES